MRILQDLLGKLGADVQPYLGTVMETLIPKLGDRNEARMAAAACSASLGLQRHAKIVRHGARPARMKCKARPRSCAQMVRRAAAAVLGAFMRTLGPQPVLNALGGAFVHPEWRVREQGLNVVLQVGGPVGPGRRGKKLLAGSASLLPGRAEP